MIRIIRIYLLSLFLLTTITATAQNVTGHLDKVEDGRSIPEMWRLTDTLRAIAIKSPNALERVEAVNCAKWIEYNIARYPERPSGEFCQFWEWRLRRVIDTCGMFQENKD